MALDWRSPADEPENEEVVLVWRDLSRSRPGATAQQFGLETYRRENHAQNRRFGITNADAPYCDVVAWARISPPHLSAIKPNLHAFKPHSRFPWICDLCGYAPHEPLKHFQPSERSEPAQ